MVNYLAAAQSFDLAAGLVPLYYAIGILALVFGGLWQLKRYNDKQREDFRKRGVQEQALSDKLDANTKAADKNTASIERMSEKFDSFSVDMGKRVTLLDYRVEQLEGKGPRPHGMSDS